MERTTWDDWDQDDFLISFQTDVHDSDFLQDTDQAVASKAIGELDSTNV